MNKIMFLLMVLCSGSFALAGFSDAVLFYDSFDRPFSNDIDTDAPSGMSGLVAPMEYVETGDELGSNAGLTNVENDQLHLADGPNMTLMYLNHNFIDSAITNNGGMRIGITIVSNDGTTTDMDRFIGFGVGNTKQECDDAYFDYNGVGFRGRVDNWAGTSDIWIGWSPVNGGTLQVFKNGPTSHGGENYDIAVGALQGNDRLELELFFDSLDDNAPVTANIFWNGEVVGTDSFSWDADGIAENYIGVDCRQNGAGFTVDDLEIDYNNNHAHNETPANGERNIAPGTVNLQWSKGLDASGNPNSEITKYYLYATDELSTTGEPNFLSNSIYYAEEIDVSSKSITVEYDQTIYWRVDQSILGSGPTDSDTMIGRLWSFDALKSVPVIPVDGQPEHAAAFEGDTASFTVTVESISETTYQWYKSDDNSNETPDDDEAIGSPIVGGGLSNTLAFGAVALEDEAYYYCLITNGGGDVLSDAAYLTVKRQVLYWALENDFTDSSGEGNDGFTDPNQAPPEFVTDVPGAVGTYAASFDGFSQRITSATLDTNDSVYHSGFTLSIWAKATVVPQVINSAFFNNNNGGPQDFQLDFDGNGMYRYQGTNNQVIATPTTEWTHFAVVCNGETTEIYVNLEGDDMAVSNGADIIFGQFQIGCNRAGDVFFNGLIDDVKIWNYPRSYDELAEDYLAVTGQGGCLDRPDWDMDNNCRIDLKDLAIFLEDWLECGLQPQSECL